MSSVNDMIWSKRAIFHANNIMGEIIDSFETRKKAMPDKAGFVLSLNLSDYANEPESIFAIIKLECEDRGWKIDGPLPSAENGYHLVVVCENKKAGE